MTNPVYFLTIIPSPGGSSHTNHNHGAHRMVENVEGLSLCLSPSILTLTRVLSLSFSVSSLSVCLSLSPTPSLHDRARVLSLLLTLFPDRSITKLTCCWMRNFIVYNRKNKHVKHRLWSSRWPRGLGNACSFQPKTTTWGSPFIFCLLEQLSTHEHECPIFCFWSKLWTVLSWLLAKNTAGCIWLDGLYVALKQFGFECCLGVLGKHS